MNLALLLSTTPTAANDEIIDRLRRRVTAYSEDEARDKDGKWTKGGESLQTVKPDEAKADAHLRNLAKNIVLYHGTADDAVTQILKEGIVPGKSAGGDEWAKENMGVDMAQGRHVSAFATTEKESALRYASIAAEIRHAVPVVIKMEVPEAVFKTSFKIDEQQLSGGAFRTEKTLPASWITGIAKGRFNDKIDPEYLGFDMVPVNHVTMGRFAKPKVSATGMKTVYFVIMVDGTKAVHAYSEDEPRDKDGKWTTGGDSEIFVSPNLTENLAIKDAIRFLASDRQTRFEAKARDVVAEVAGGGKVEGAIGVWADGAENSTAITLPHAEGDVLRYIASLLGKSGAQKAVLAWQNAANGPHALYTLSTSLTPTQVAADSLKLGIAFQTIIPSYQGGRIQILDEDGSLAGKVEALGSLSGYKPVGVQRGSGEFIGSWTSREEGNVAYDKIIQDYEKVHQGYKGSLQFSSTDGNKGWSDLYRRIEAAKINTICRCGHTLAQHPSPDYGCKFCGEEQCPGFLQLRAYSPDEARDKNGKWTRGDDSGTAEFKAWFGKSQVTDKHGNPLLVHHGAGAAMHDEIRNDQYRIGLFFSTSKALAQRYGPTVISAYLKIEHPLVVHARGNGYDDISPVPKELRDWVVGDRASTDLIAEYAFKHGYDGAIIKNVTEPNGPVTTDDYVVFHSEQIRRVGESVKAYSPDEARDKNGRWASDADGNDVPVKPNADGTVTMYHGTTKENADAIVKSKRLKSAGEPDVYMSTSPTGLEYGDGTVVAVDVHPRVLHINDEFPSGRKDYSIHVGLGSALLKRARILPSVEAYSPDEARDKDGKWSSGSTPKGVQTVYRGSKGSGRSFPDAVFVSLSKDAASQYGDVKSYKVDFDSQKLLDVDSPAAKQIVNEFLQDDLTSDDFDDVGVPLFMFPDKQWVAFVQQHGYTGTQIGNEFALFTSLSNLKAYSPDEARDKDGKWSSGGAQVESPAFKAWFKDSKVVDTAGHPLVVYHGTTHDFDSFSLDHAGKNDDGYLGRGFYFGNKMWADTYAGKYSNAVGGNVKPVYLALQNPLKLSADFDGRREKDRALTIRHALGLASSASPKDVTSALVLHGFDGVVYTLKGDNEYVALFPNQIKSAIGNSGKFDPTNDKITAKFNPDEARDKDGEWTDGGQRDRAADAKRTYNPATLEKQRIADEAEMWLSKAVGLPRTKNNSAFDLVGKGVAVEVKTLVDRKRDEITMHPESLQRKQKEARKTKVNAYTVVLDERPGKQQVYWKAGVGSFVLSTMNRATSVQALRKVLVPR